MVESIHGKGTFVRKATVPAATLDRTITRTGKHHAAGSDTLTSAEAPAVTRTTLTAAQAALLDRDEGDAAFSTERLLTDPATGTRVLHRVLIPFDTANQAPPIAEHPDTEPAQLYDTLAAAAGHALSWTETVTARAPLPEERAALNAPDAAAILITHRTTHGTDDRPLLLEEQRVSADAAQLTYRITAEKTAAQRRTTATGPESA
ncbi:UTRA domain-containing protein [Streptomyces sp. NPDC005355]|uniref:UTRA domain-containing protein n=1 Tax=Streptomyces sp. NPDC005355 TaxID=3157038 RepID=UPI0033AD2FF9